MFYKRLRIIYSSYLLLLDIRLIRAERGTNTRINEDGNIQNLVKSRFFDPANVGFLNFAPEDFGNLEMNYPTDSPFVPLGNQFPNFHRSGPDYGWGPRNQYPNEVDFQGSELNQNQGIFSNHRGLLRPGFTGIHDPTSHNMNTNQNNPWVSVPDDKSLLNVIRPHPNGESNYQRRKINSVTPIQDGYYYGQDSNYFPDTRSQFTKIPMYHSIENTQYSPDNGIYQYNHFPDTRNGNFQTGSNENTQPLYTSNFPSKRNPQNNQGGTNGNHKLYSPPIKQSTGKHNGFNFNAENLYGVHQKTPTQNIPNEHADPDRKVAILGKPVFLPLTETTESNDVDEESLKKAVKKQCVQDCDTTSEYKPICGTDNVTYINPEKFACARNCGFNVNISRYGRCNDDPASNAR